MTAGCTTSGTDPAPGRGDKTRREPADRPRPARRVTARLVAAALPALLAGTALAADPPKPPPASAPPELLTAVQLRDRFEKILKGLGKAQDAAGGRDAGRVSLLLQRADELVVEFEQGCGLDRFIASIAAARAGAAKGDYSAARADLRRGRESLRSLSDYSVARPAEVAYRAADQSLEEENAHDFAAAVDRLEATVLPGFLHSRLADARAAIARARTAMVKRDMAGGRREIDAARIAIGRLDYASALSQARYACIIGAELVGENAYLVAREYLQDALRQIARALRRAPEADVDPLHAAQAEVTDVWRRLSKPQPGDAGKVAMAGDTIETLRQRLR